MFDIWTNVWYVYEQKLTHRGLETKTIEMNQMLDLMAHQRKGRPGCSSQVVCSMLKARPDPKGFGEIHQEKILEFETIYLGFLTVMNAIFPLEMMFGWFLSRCLESKSKHTQQAIWSLAFFVDLMQQKVGRRTPAIFFCGNSRPFVVYVIKLSVPQRSAHN